MAMMPWYGSRCTKCGEILTNRDIATQDLNIKDEIAWKHIFIDCVKED